MVGMCGEAAADPLLEPLLIGWGLEEFSMSAPSIAARPQDHHQPVDQGRVRRARRGRHSPATHRRGQGTASSPQLANLVSEVTAWLEWAGHAALTIQGVL